MANDGAKPHVKRVQAYPIDATLTAPDGFKKISILMINTLGVIARTSNLMLKVGIVMELTVELPAGHGWVRNMVKVVKTYDRSAQAGGIERMAEFHFVSLDPEYAKHISHFMTVIGQKA